MKFCFEFYLVSLSGSRKVMTMFLKSVLRVFGISQTSYGRTSGGNRTFHRVGALLWTRWWVSRLKLWVAGRPGGGQGMAWETAANLIDLMGPLLLSVHCTYTKRKILSTLDVD